MSRQQKKLLIGLFFAGLSAAGWAGRTWIESVNAEGVAIKKEVATHSVELALVTARYDEILRRLARIEAKVDKR